MSKYSRYVRQQFEKFGPQSNLPWDKDKIVYLIGKIEICSLCCNCDRLENGTKKVSEDFER
jgi:hypothetical protein